MADSIGEASVKITADITPLQQAVAKAKQSLEPLKKDTKLGDFTVNWGSGSGSIKEYNTYLTKANKEWEEYQAQQAITQKSTEELEQSTAILAETMHKTSEAVATTTNHSSSLSSMYEAMKDKAVEMGDAAYGSFRRTTDSVRELHRVGRTALIALGVSIVMFGKRSIDEFSKYDKSFSDTMEGLKKSTSEIKAAFGSALAPLAQLAAGVLKFAAENRELTAGLITATAVIAGGAGITAAVVKLGAAFKALGVFASSSLGIVGLVVGIATALMVSNQDFSVSLEEASEASKKHTEATKAMNSAYKDYQGSLSNVAEEIAEIRKQMKEVERDYRQSLKGILVSHEDTVKSLTEQIKEANKDYLRAVEERNVAFEVSQLKEERKHQEKVDELTAQLRFLQRYNNDYNRQKLEQVQFALAKESRLHLEQTLARKAELDLQNQIAKEKYEERLVEYQSELDKELDFLKKHRVLLDGVRGEILDDEVESLTRQYEAQVASYNKQIENAGRKGAEAAERWSNAYTQYLSDTDAITKAGEKVGSDFAKAVDKGLIERTGEWIKKGGFAADAWEVMLGKERFNRWKTEGIKSGWATGGYTGPGNPNDIAGVVHKGEYVIPAHLVNQETGTPKKMGDNITINVTGVFATSAAERRKVADQIVAALQQTNQARLNI